MERVFVMSPELSNIPVIDRFIGFCIKWSITFPEFLIKIDSFFYLLYHHTPIKTKQTRKTNIKQSRKTEE